MPKAAPPGGPALALARRVAERVLWARVAVRRRLEGRGPRPLPPSMPDTDLLQSSEQWQAAVAECKRLKLPLHRDIPKNWDALGAVGTILRTVGREAAVLDAGAARYSSILPWLRLYGLTDLVGNNLEFGREVRRDGVLFRYGDITRTDFPDHRFDAVTCMSVIEHGVELEPFLAEAARIIRPGGLLIVATDYDQEPPDTTGITAYGQPVRIFSPEQIQDFVWMAADHGLRLRGELKLEHTERPVYWNRTRLDYTFIRVAFDRA
jgi:SAM-dependent methyltransferase